MPLSLRELEARFVVYVVGVAHEGHGRRLSDGTTQWGGFPVDVLRSQHEDGRLISLAEAQGILFLCPLCYAKNGGKVGTHSVGITFANRGAPENHGGTSTNGQGQPSRWSVVGGTGLDDLQLSPSIALDGTGGGCGWHGFVGTAGVPPGHAQ